MKRYEVKFKYIDAYTRGRWREQSCSVCARDEHEARRKCVEFYGLGTDCEYEILSITEEM